MKRREFLQITGASGLGLMLGYNFVSGEVINTAIQDVELNTFIYIETDGTVTILNHMPELGQGVFQAVPMIIAEELEVDINSVKIVQSGVDAEKYGRQNIGGSTTVRRGYTDFRTKGAAGKAMLIGAAAQKWGCAETDCFAQNGFVLRKGSATKLSYGDLVQDAALLTPPKNVQLKDSKDFTILGKSTLRQDIPPKVNGEVDFGIDVELENMLYASVLRTPYLFGAVDSYNKEQIDSMPGISTSMILKTRLFGKPREGVAVLSEDYHTAYKGRSRLSVNWKDLPESYDDEKIFQKFHEEKLKTPSGKRTQNEDSTADANETTSISAEYECPYQAHSPMEPMNATVWVKENKSIEAWLPTQNGQRAQDNLEEVTGIPKENIKIHMTFIGGGFGRRSLQDFAIEAAILSQQTGRPVKVIWNREDDTVQGPFRPATLNVLRAGFDANKKLTSFSNHIVTQIIGHQNPGSDMNRIGSGTYSGSYWGYKFVNYTQSARSVALPVPIWYWRSVYASTNAFVNESFVDEVAHHMGIDSLDFRLRYMDDKRAIALLQTLRKQSSWDNPGEGEYKGIAFSDGYDSYSAQVITVEKLGGGVKIKKVDAAIDCGQNINPDTIEAQMESSIIMALTAAYKSSISIKGGMVTNTNYHNFELLRYDETPEIDVLIMKTDHAPGGVGEAGFPPTAPALANAIFKATGIRVRKLPITAVAIS